MIAAASVAAAPTVIATVLARVVAVAIAVILFLLDSAVFMLHGPLQRTMQQDLLVMLL